MVSKISENRVASRRSVRRGGLAQRLWNTKAAIALGLFAVVLPACTRAPEPEAAAPGVATSVAEVAEEPNAGVMGKTVTVKGEIEKVLNPRAFIVEGKGWLFNDPEVLVVSATGAPLIPDTPVVVTGTVRKLVVADIEREYDFDLAQEYEVEFREKPVLVATGVALSPTLDNITKNTNAYLGRTVAITGEVDKVLGPRAFTIDDNDLLGEEDLLVVNATTPVTRITEGSRVQVIGPVRRFVKAEVEREFDWWEPGQEFEVEFENKPSIIAQAVQVGDAANAVVPVPAATAPAAPGAATSAPATPAPRARVDDPGLIGEPVTASVTVARVLSPQAFIVRDEETFDNQPVLVVSSTTAPNVKEGTAIELTGIYHKLVVADIEKEYGLDLAPDVVAQIRTRPYIVVKTIERVD